MPERRGNEQEHEDSTRTQTSIGCPRGKRKTYEACLGCGEIFMCFAAFEKNIKQVMRRMPLIDDRLGLKASIRVVVSDAGEAY